ncbi:uncharacterized protein [Dysidea avara]|uniref:uncharacterized protein isoform X2 n=1 Tax=Dysidea avara TaxID=196820 RepID=UPI0033256CCC
MAAAVILSDDYIERFYREHVAVAGKANLDDDIRAIEEEIDKVKRYQSMLKGGIPSRFDTSGALNSCGNSDASSDDNLSGDEYEPTPTSVFKVYDSSRDPLHGAPTMDIFSWARLQLVSHDHSYYSTSNHDNTSLIDHGSICVENVRWGALKVPDYNNAIRKLLGIISCHDNIDTAVEGANSLDRIPRDLSRFVKVTSVRGRDSDYHGNRSMPLRRSGANHSKAFRGHKGLLPATYSLCRRKRNYSVTMTTEQPKSHKRHFKHEEVLKVSQSEDTDPPLIVD